MTQLCPDCAPTFIHRRSRRTRRPQFRVQVVRRPHGDLVQIKAAHPAIDGIGLMRLGRSITDAYRGKPEPPSPLPLEEARDLQAAAAPEEFFRAGGSCPGSGRKLKDAAIPPARVAPDTTDSRTGPGFAHRTIGAEQLVELNARRPKGTTFNDMLIGAVGIAVQEWNRQHHVDANKISAFVPVNLRPAEWYTDVVTNMFSSVSVSTMRRDRIDLASAAKAVAEQTAPIRRDVRALGAQDLLRLGSPLPLGAKRRMPRLLRLTGNRSRFVDTVVVSFMGRPKERMSFFGDYPSELYATSPYWGAAAVSVFAIVVGSTLSSACGIASVHWTKQPEIDWQTCSLPRSLATIWCPSHRPAVR